MAGKSQKKWINLWTHITYKQLYGNKSSRLENLEEMSEFMDTYNLQKLNHEATEKLKRTTATNEILSEIKSLPKRKTTG